MAIGALTAGLVLAGILAVRAEVKSANNLGPHKEPITDADKQTSHQSGRGHLSVISAILIVQSLSCPCTVEACKTAEQIVDGLRNDYADIAEFEAIDYEYQSEKAKPLLDRYSVFMIPTLIVLDGEDHLLWKCEDFSNEQSIRAKFEQLLGKGVTDENETNHTRNSFIVCGNQCHLPRHG